MMTQTNSDPANVGVLAENVRHNEKAIDIMRVDIDRRFDKVDARFDKIETELKALREDVNTRFFQLLLGLIISVLTPIAIELFKHFN